MHLQGLYSTFSFSLGYEKEVLLFVYSYLNTHAYFSTVHNRQVA
jgi:hypothetical protein